MDCFSCKTDYLDIGWFILLVINGYYNRPNEIILNRGFWLNTKVIAIINTCITVQVKKYIFE